MSTSEEQPDGLADQKPFSFASIASLSGAVSISIVAICSISSWAFARGLTTKLGLPASIVTLRTAIDMFSAMAFTYAFVVLFAFGFAYTITTPPESDKDYFVRACICVGCFVLLFFIALKSIYTDGLTTQWFLIVRFAGVMSPAIMAFAMRSLNRPPRTWFLILLAFSIVLVSVGYVYQSGIRLGGALMGTPTTFLPGSGFVEFKISDFPMVAIRTKSEVKTLVGCERKNDGFECPGPGPGFMRLILQDDSNYYFVENMQGHAHSFSVRKDAVLQVVFGEGDSIRATQ
jgi:hypothetical protein